MRLRWIIKRFLQASLLLFLTGSIGLAFILIERGTPPFSGIPVNQQPVASTDVNRIFKRIRLLTSQENSWLQLSEKDLQLMLQHALTRLQQMPLPVLVAGNTYMHNRSQEGGSLESGSMKSGSVEIAASIAIDTPPGWFTRVGITLKQTRGKPYIDYLQLGRLTIPGPVANKVWGYLVSPLLPNQSQKIVSSLTESIQHFDINDNSMFLGVRLTGELREQLRANSLRNLIAPGTAEDRKLYQQVLEAGLSTGQGPTMSLSPVLRIMAGLAYTRTQTGHSATDENKLLIYTMAQAIAPPEIRRMLGGGKTTVGASRLTLHQRHDLAQHFLISAALAVQLGEDTALQIGFNKEMEDARPGGSGFSFTDLAADVAGLEFSGTATDEDSANQLQQFLMAHSEESDYLPLLSGLPEGLSIAQFRSTFQGPGSPAYEEKFNSIETSIRYAPLYLSFH